MHLETRPNEHDTPVAHFQCGTCGEPFTITPAPECFDDWQNCLSPQCASYDTSRDVDHLFDDGDTISFTRRKHPGCVVRRYTDA